MLHAKFYKCKIRTSFSYIYTLFLYIHLFVYIYNESCSYILYISAIQMHIAYKLTKIAIMHSIDIAIAIAITNLCIKLFNKTSQQAR